MEVKMVKVSAIVEYENNAKVHTESQIDALARQIDEFGFDQPLVLGKGNTLIKGHGRLMAARQLGLKEVPCVIRDDLSDAEADLSRIVDNECVDTSWDMHTLGLEIGGVMDSVGDMGSFELPDSVIDLALKSRDENTVVKADELSLDEIKATHHCDVCGYRW